LGNEQVLRQAYKIAENKDLEGWVAALTDDGTFTDESIGVTYGGPDGLPEQVGNYARAFPAMQRVLAVPDRGRITMRGLVACQTRRSCFTATRTRSFPSGTLKADGRPSSEHIPKT
jgi:hypothetical protein